MEVEANRPKASPKDFFVWLGALVALYSSVIAFITLMFEYINRAFPDPLQYYYVDAYGSAIKFAISTLIVMAPLFLVLMRLIRHDIAAQPEKAQLWVRRWALYLSLFIAGIVLAGDLITLVNFLLDGDITARFLLKVAVILLVALGFFLHFLADVRGYWITNPRYAASIGLGVGVLVLVSIVAAFFVIGTPAQQRMMRFDDQKTSDLSNIQGVVMNYWQSKGALPENLAALNDSISGFTAPKDPQTGQEYGYRITGSMSFEVCATFNTQSFGTDSSYTEPMGRHMGGDTWNHGVGQTCFERTIDPELYPPTSKPLL